MQSPPLLIIAVNIPSSPGPLWTALSNMPNAACVLVMLHAPVSPSSGVGPGAAAAMPPDEARPPSTIEDKTAPLRKPPCIWRLHGFRPGAARTWSGRFAGRDEARVGVRVGGERPLDDAVEEQAAVA